MALIASSTRGESSMSPAGRAMQCGEILREDNAVRAMLEQMHLGGDVIVYTCLVEGEAVLYRDNAVVGGGEDEDCECVAGDAVFT
jgi:hypothetical protein